MGSLTISMMLTAAMLFGGTMLLNLITINNTLTYIIRHDGEIYRSAQTAETETTDSTFGVRVLEDIFYINPQNQSPEFVYTARYFVIWFDSDQQVTDVRTNHISAVSEEEAEAYGEYALKRNKKSGRMDNFYYRISHKTDGSGLVVYLDGSSVNQSNIRLLYLAVIFICFGVALAFFVARRFVTWALKGEMRSGEIQKQFMTDISHELKTPLAVIRANTEMQELLNGEDEWSRSTLRQVERMNGLIQNLVTIARAQERSTEIVDEVVDVTSAVHETTENFRSLSLSTGKTLEEDLESQITMRAEEAQIRQLCSLLVDNAIKYCDDGGTIRVSLQTRGRSLLLKVENTYAEGADVDYTRFFERFYRQDASHNIDKGGYGIGLSVAESIVHRYRGDISVTWNNGVISFNCQMPRNHKEAKKKPAAAQTE